MYACPNECGSVTFEQTVKQGETVHTDDGGAPMYIEKADTVDVLDVTCAKCGAEVEA